MSHPRITFPYDGNEARGDDDVIMRMHLVRQTRVHNVSHVYALDTSTMKYMMRYSENVHFVLKQVTERPRNNHVISEVNVFSSLHKYILNFIII